MGAYVVRISCQCIFLYMIGRGGDKLVPKTVIRDDITKQAWWEDTPESCALVIAILEIPRAGAKALEYALRSRNPDAYIGNLYRKCKYREAYLKKLREKTPGNLVEDMRSTAGNYFDAYKKKVGQIRGPKSSATKQTTTVSFHRTMRQEGDKPLSPRESEIVATSETTAKTLEDDWTANPLAAAMIGMLIKRGAKPEQIVRAMKEEFISDFSLDMLRQAQGSKTMDGFAEDLLASAEPLLGDDAQSRDQLEMKVRRYLG